jgi:transcription initiation factor TFIID TATA-box-binding protein
MDDPEVVILLFGSGKIVITGGKTPEDATVGVKNMTERITDLGLAG